MKTQTQVETTITAEFTAPEVANMLKDKGIIPLEWDYFSIDVEGLGVSQGMIVTIKYKSSPK